MALKFNIMQNNNYYPASLVKLGKNTFKIIVDMNDSTYELRFIDNKFSLVNVTNGINKHYIDIPLSYSFKNLISTKIDNREYTIPLPNRLPFINDDKYCSIMPEVSIVDTSDLMDVSSSINIYMDEKDLIIDLVDSGNLKKDISILDNITDKVYLKIQLSYRIPDAENLIKEFFNLIPDSNDLNDHILNFNIYRMSNLFKDNYEDINLTIVSRDDWYRIINHTNGIEEDFYGMFTDGISRYLSLSISLSHLNSYGVIKKLIFKGESDKNLLWIPVPGCENFKIASPILNESNFNLYRKNNILNIYRNNDSLNGYRMDNNVDEFLNIINGCFEKFEQKQSLFLKSILKED